MLENSNLINKPTALIKNEEALQNFKKLKTETQNQILTGLFINLPTIIRFQEETYKQKVEYDFMSEGSALLGKKIGPFYVNKGVSFFHSKKEMTGCRYAGCRIFQKTLFLWKSVFLN